MVLLINFKLVSFTYIRRHRFAPWDLFSFNHGHAVNSEYAALVAVVIVDTQLFIDLNFFLGSEIHQQLSLYLFDVCLDVCFS